MHKNITYVKLPSQNDVSAICHPQKLFFNVPPHPSTLPPLQEIEGEGRPWQSLRLRTRNLAVES